MMMKLTITGYSTALFSTWYFIDELGLLFDAGDGLSAGLLQKSRKIKHAFISHADRDHLCGLLQFNQLNAREDWPAIYFPKDCGSFPFMEDFSKKFDPHVAGTRWQPMVAGEKVPLRDDLFVLPIRNGHVEAEEGVTKSLSFKLIHTKRKLKPELSQLSAEEVKQMVMKEGKEATTEEVQTNYLSYSGDTPVEDYDRFDQSKVLIHEATFLEEGGKPIVRHGNRHSTLDEVMKMVSQIQIETLVLGHFSSRYSQTQIDTSIRQLAKKYHIQIPIYRVLPGEILHDILHGHPINQ